MMNMITYPCWDAGSQTMLVKGVPDTPDRAHTPTIRIIISAVPIAMMDAGLMLAEKSE